MSKRIFFLFQWQSSPEALGSPAGYVVLPGRCLLWPHIRTSQLLSSTYWLYDESLPYSYVWAETERLPNLLRKSLSIVPPSIPRWIEQLHLTVATLFILAFATCPRARHPQAHTGRFSRGGSNEAAKFALCCGPMELQALHRQGLLHPSFHPLQSPE